MIYQSLKEKQRQEREGLILQATQDLLLERGYYDTSMGEIALRVGVAKGTLYQHFESKEALMIALFKREFQDLQAAIEQIILMDADAQVKLSAAIDVLCQQISEKHPLFFILRHTADLGTELHVEVKDSFAAARDNIATILDQGKDEGMFNPALPTEVMLEALFGIIVSRLFKNLHHGVAFEYADLVGSLKCIYFHGITAAPAS